MIQFKACDWHAIKEEVKAYYQKKHVIVDSYWEDHVLESKHYQLMLGDEAVGFFAVHKQGMITLFHLDDSSAHYGQNTFKEARRMEQVTCAMVPTGDELLMSLCLDDYQKIEKNAYFLVYTDRKIEKEKRKKLELIPVSREDQLSLLDLAVDFFGEKDGQRVLDTSNHFNIFLVEENASLVGFGVVEESRVVEGVASIGMYVLEEKRQKGYAKNILKSLKELVEEKGFKARSGCWYYNHSSKKSIEAAGGFAKSRLLRFYF